MSQRILFAACLVTTAACLTLTGLVWHQANQAARATAESNLRLAELLAKTHGSDQAKLVDVVVESHKTNEQILKQLQAMVMANQSPDWVPVSFKLIQEKPDGPPATGYDVVLGKGLRGRSGEVIESGVNDVADKVIRRQSGSDGLVDFGAVHPGDWDFTISVAGSDRYAWSCEGTINVLPGTKAFKTIICPKSTPDLAAVKLHIQWPADLVDKDLGVLATFVREPTIFQPANNWRLANAGGSEYFTRVLLGPRGFQGAVGEGIELELQPRSNESVGNRGFDKTFAAVHALSSSLKQNDVLIPVGSYAVRQVVVMAPCGRGAASQSGARFEIIGYANETTGTAPSALAASSAVPFRPTSVTLGDIWNLGIETHQEPIMVKLAYWQDLRGRFDVRRGEVNEWKVSLPDVLAAFVHERLRAETGADDHGKDQGLYTEVSISP